MWIGKTKFENPEAAKIVEAMRQKLAKEFGVTVQGSIVTVRWYEQKDGPLVSVSMSIHDVDNGEADWNDFEDK
jgi:predicted NUDIX family NTP pyrophosphohydrolase